jgi:hypothetical protein
MNLGGRLFWYALAAMSPVFAVVLLFQYQLTTDSNAGVRAGVSRQTLQARSDLLRLIESMRTLMVAIAATDSVRQFDDAACTAFL